MRKEIRVLIVDDHQVVREGLQHLLSYEEDIEIVGQCANSIEALTQAEQLSPNIILMDIKMPDVDGIELTRLVREKFPACNIIMLTLYDEYLDQAIKAGAKGYLTKDIKREELSDAIRHVHHGQVVISENIKARPRIEPTEKNSRRLEDYSDIFEDTVQAIAVTVEMRDPYTADHQRRVARLATMIAREMGLPEGRIGGLRLACLVHDIGKARVPAEILSNPRKLSSAEFSIIRTHPLAGYDILKNVDFPQPVAQIVYQHHERMDGSGYPEGISGDTIILEARILAVADVVEAMSSHRPYRPAVGLDKALKEISKHRGTYYDADVVDACLRVCTRDDFTLGEEAMAANLREE